MIKKLVFSRMRFSLTKRLTGGTSVCRVSLATMATIRDQRVKLPTRRIHHDSQSVYHLMPTSFKYSFEIDFDK